MPGRYQPHCYSFLLALGVLEIVDKLMLEYDGQVRIWLQNEALRPLGRKFVLMVFKNCHEMLRPSVLRWNLMAEWSIRATLVLKFRLMVNKILITINIKKILICFREDLCEPFWNVLVIIVHNSFGVDCFYFYFFLL